MRRYLGIDPGVTGAVALLTVHDDGTQALTVQATPCDWVQVGSGKRRRYNAYALFTALEAVGPRLISLAYLEQQSARPKQGVASTFSTGFGFGLWVGLLTALAIPFAIVPPRRWRARAGLAAHPKGTAPKAIKTAVRLAACRRFPAVPINLDHADAVMLAVAAALEHGLPAREALDPVRPTRPGATS